MKFWFDTEFIEDGNTIDLISIGMVSQDGREYYAISKEFDASKASTWVINHVLKHLPPVEVIGMPINGIVYGNELVCSYPPEYRTREEIKNDILKFVSGGDQPEFWAYYADYDWVVLCQLFGRMIDLPKGWPRYCRDIKQLCDSLGNPKLPKPEGTEHHALDDARWVKQAHAFLEEVK